MLFSARYFWGVLICLIASLFIFSHPAFAQWKYDGRVPILSVSVTGTGCTTSGSTTTCNQATTINISVTCQDSGPNESGCSYGDINGQFISGGNLPYSSPQNFTDGMTDDLVCGDPPMTYTIFVQDFAGNITRTTHTVVIDCTICIPLTAAAACPTYCGYTGGNVSDNCGGTLTCSGQSPCGFSCDAGSDAYCNGNNPAVSVGWSPASGATYYNVYRNSTYISTAYYNAYNDQSALQRNTSYSYVISACNGWGCTNTSCPNITTPWCDGQPPTVSLYTPILETCYTNATWNALNPLQVNATDQPPGGNSGVANVQIRVKNNETGAESTPRPIPPQLAIFNSTTGRWQVNVPFTDLVPATGAYGNHFDILIEGVDSEGNRSGFISQVKNFEVRSNCQPAFLQTTGGSVHSNENIDVPNRNAP